LEKVKGRLFSQSSLFFTCLKKTVLALIYTPQFVESIVKSMLLANLKN